MRSAGCALLLLALALAGCTAPPPDAGPASIAVGRPSPGFHPIVRFGTDHGDVYIEVYQEQVPATAANFLGYVAADFYDGTKVHRVLGPPGCERTRGCPPEGVLMQLGDPLTKDATRSRDLWGQGDPRLPQVFDEFNVHLRHDRAGVVSMMNTGPNTATSQFFITLTAIPSLDDRNSVFGRVVAGMDVVRAIGNVSTDEVDRPLRDVVIRSSEIIAPQRAAKDEVHSLAAHSWVPSYNVVANRTLQLAAVVANTGNVVEEVNGTLLVPEGWLQENVQPLNRTVPAGQTRLFLFWLLAPEGTPPGEHAVTARFRTNQTNATADVPLTIRVVPALGAEAREGSTVRVDYVGALPDGRMFDTSIWSIATNATLPKFPRAFELRPQAAYEPLEFTIGQPGIIRGFSLGTTGVREGESRASFMTPASGYGEWNARTNDHPLASRHLVFHIALRQVNATAPGNATGT